jgi:two-component system cell cycle sensor histidine kinase/response regulator CckA
MTGYLLSDLLNLVILQRLADAHYRAAGMPIGIIDAIDGSILVGSGWQDICVKFHRSNPTALKRCRESDDYIKEHLVKGEACHYKCMNGLWDIGMPILVAGDHLATMFLGQFFYEGEVPDRDFFRRQALQLGFHVDDYLAALDRVPVFSREKVDYILEYDKTLVSFIADLAESELLNIRANDAIRESERKFRAIFENAVEGMFQTTPDGRYLAVNPALARMYGYNSPEEMIGAITNAGKQQYVNPEDRTVLKSLFEKQGFVENFETQLYRKDGSKLWISMTARAVKSADGEILYYEGTTEDITERKRVEEVLLDSESKYRTVVESSLVGVYIVQDGLFRFVNNRWCEMYGYTYDETVNRIGPLDLTPPEDRSLLMENFRKRLSGESGSIEYEIRALRKDGRVIIVKILGSLTLYRGLPAISGTVYDITGQKAAEQRVTQLAAIVESSHDAIIGITTDGIIANWNRGAEQISGYDEHEIVGKSISMLTPPGQEDEGVRILKRIKSGEHSEEYETVWQRKDGQYHHMSLAISPVRDTEGRIAGASVIGRDITERKHAEEALKQNESFLNTLLDAIPIPVFYKDRNGRYLGVNRAFETFFAATRKELIGKTVFDISPPELAETYHTRDNELFERGGIQQYESQVKDAPGVVHDVIFNEAVFTDSEGTIHGLIGAILDITGRKHMEEELKTAHQRLFDIIEFLPDATFVIDHEKKVVAWNLACEEITGVKKYEIIGKGDYAYGIPFYGERRPILIDYVTMGPDDDLERRYMSVRRKGHLLYAEAFAPMLYQGKGAYLSGRASPLFDKTGQVVGAIENLQDITEFKHLETQLRQAQKMEAIGTLAGGIAHDFNNLLTVFTGYGTLLQMGLGKDNPLRIYVDQMLSSAEKATQLTHGLLAFSRKQPITLKPMELNGVIKGTEKLLQRLLTEDIELKVGLTTDETAIMGDATQIDQILFNLATNARDAMPKGGRLTIETTSAELDREFNDIHGYGKPGRYVLLSVSDTGIGMNDVTREHIFDPFFTTKEVGKGTGLGLSTVYGIVMQHNGYISVYSESNKGTTFHIYFPTIERAGGEEERPSAPVRRGDETILVAEDSEAVRSLMSRVLREYGYRIIEAIDGADAVEQFKKAKRIDLLILDSVMPKMNGREAYDEICKVNPDVRVIFTSGYTRDVFVGKGIEDKRFDFIQKPISPTTLLQRVREVLDKGGTSV